MTRLPTTAGFDIAMVALASIAITWTVNILIALGVGRRVGNAVVWNK